MRLRNLFEAFGEEVAIIFGRFNPPHKGHRAAWELASKSPIWYVGTNESTVGPKDPLPFDVKVEAMKTVWPKVESHIVAETSWLTLASKVYEKNPNATLLCLTDEDWVTKTIIQYNGKEGAHGFYNFKKIKQKPTPRLSSATALRDAVSKGERDAFTQAAGVDADTPVAGKPFFDLVAEYLMPYQNAPKKVAKKKKEPSVAEAFGPLPKDNQQIRLGRHTVDIERVGLNKNYISFAWHDSKGKEHYEEVAVGDLGSYDDLITKIKQEISHQERQYTDQGVAEGSNVDSQIKRIKDRILQLKDWNTAGTHDKKIKELQARLKELQQQKQGVAEGAKGASKNKETEFHAKLDKLVHNTFGKRKDESDAVKHMAKDLTNPPKIMQHRAKRDQEREEQLKSRNIAKKNEDAAGVGIITKQNSTVDVNKNTPRKNLKAFRLVK